MEFPMNLRLLMRGVLCAFGIVALLTSPLCFAQAKYKDPYVAGEMIVSLVPGKAISQFHGRHGTRTKDQLPGTTRYRVAVPPGKSVDEMVKGASSDSDVIWAKPNFVHQTPEVRQGSMAFIDQGSMAFIDGQSPWQFFGQAQMDRIRIKEAQRISRGAGVRVAVIDTGIDYSHPLFAGRIHKSGYDFVDNDANPTDELGGNGTGHGTFVAGLIVLAAPDVTIIPLRAFSTDGRGTSYDIARAIRYAVDSGADVINMSFGLRDQDELIRDAMYYAWKRKIFMVASAGNSGEEAVNFPASDDMALAVTSTNGSNDSKAIFANYGSSVDVSAPGTELYSAFPGNRWATWGGTSFSTALVAGEAALLLAKNCTLKFSFLRTKIMGNGVPINEFNPQYVNKLGTVRIDFLAAVEAAFSYEVSGAYDNERKIMYAPDGPYGSEAIEDLNTPGEDYVCEISAGIDSWWQLNFNDPRSVRLDPSRASLKISYRPESGWHGVFTLQYLSGSDLLASVNVPVDNRYDGGRGRGRGRRGDFRWDLSGLIRTRADIANARVRLINQNTTGKRIWISLAALDTK
jgi:hypothetical protein